MKITVQTNLLNLCATKRPSAAWAMAHGVPMSRIYVDIKHTFS